MMFRVIKKIYISRVPTPTKMLVCLQQSSHHHHRHPQQLSFSTHQTQFNDSRILFKKIDGMKKKHNVRGVLTLYNSHATTLNAIHLENIYGALARSVQGADKVATLQNEVIFQKLLTNTIDKLQSNPNFFDVRAIASIAYSLGKLNIPDERFFNEVVKLRHRLAREADPQHLSNVALAFATVGRPSEELFAAVAGQQERIIGSGNVQAMSNICLAFAKTGYKADALFTAVAGQHDRIVGSGKVPNLSNTCWAFVTAGHKADALFTAVAAEHDVIVRSGNPQEVSERTL